MRPRTFQGLIGHVVSLVLSEYVEAYTEDKRMKVNQNLDKMHTSRTAVINFHGTCTRAVHHLY